ncbi:hypothetical protein IFM89_025155 [Coptis chinensis]|uniref:F-box associated beta-propeller type 1 domain-containing protein n=1 Tax=Coptis chinensis TaxID=261450 RepID=A0A835LP11_9MAGN|nr:hypothetical protein IFM89_025155 [Coptis chinensis]
MKDNGDRLFVIHTTLSPFGYDNKNSLSLLSGDKFKDSISIGDIDLPDILKEDRCTYIIASCNGLVCLFHDLISPFNHCGVSTDVSLWNPATKQFRLLPSSPSATAYQRKNSEKVVGVSLGFGFDAKNSDYKVIRFIFMEGIPLGSCLLVELYSLSTDSWRTIDVVLTDEIVLPDTCVRSCSQALYRNEIFCWLGTGNLRENGSLKGNQRMILSFDFGNQVFGSMPLPDSMKSIHCLHCFEDKVLAILRENIACIVLCSLTPEITTWDYDFEIWVMNEFGVKESWTKLYTVGPFSIPRQKGFSKNGEFLFTSDSTCLCLYDLFTREKKIIRIEDFGSIQVVFYKESLVSTTSASGVNNKGYLCSDEQVQGDTSFNTSGRLLFD